MKNNTNKHDKINEKWPKKIPKLTDEQIRIRDEWMKYWHEILPNKYGIIEKFNHGFPVKAMNTKTSNNRIMETLEIGAGLGEHINYEDLNNQKYYVLELRSNMIVELKKKFPSITPHLGDIQKKTEFHDEQFDRILAIHVLEHLPDLPSALMEVYRILKYDGKFTVVLPCEGGLAYRFARYVSSSRIFQKKFEMKYDWLMRSEHLNQPYEIIEELKKEFTIIKKTFFPFVLPLVFCNLCIGLDLKKRF